jgi:hypothetical protein
LHHFLGICSPKLSISSVSSVQAYAEVHGSSTETGTCNPVQIALKQSEPVRKRTAWHPKLCSRDFIVRSIIEIICKDVRDLNGELMREKMDPHNLVKH